MKDIDILPKEMMAKSLSQREVILPYEDALKALDIFLDAGWAFLGWEGWIKTTTGEIGQTVEFIGAIMGTVSIEQEEGESWKEYAKRGYDFMKETIIMDDKDWKKSKSAKIYELYFCISASSKDGLKKLRERMRKNK